VDVSVNVDVIGRCHVVDGAMDVRATFVFDLFGQSAVCIRDSAP
jgi:hypothetical protein